MASSARWPSRGQQQPTPDREMNWEGPAAAGGDKDGPTTWLLSGIWRGEPGVGAQGTPQLQSHTHMQQARSFLPRADALRWELTQNRALMGYL